MAKLEIKRIKIKNFMSIAGADVAFDRNGLYLVSGVNEDDPGRSNGSGKSTIAEALVWCLYGRTLRDLPDKDAVLRIGRITQTRQETSVEAEVYKGEGTFYVTRTRRFGQASRLTWGGLTDSVMDRVLRPTDDETLATFLGMDFKAFCSSVVFGGSSAFKFSALSDAERREVLNGAIGADVYLRAADLAREKARAARLDCAVKTTNVAVARQALRQAKADHQDALEDLDGLCRSQDDEAYDSKEYRDAAKQLESIGSSSEELEKLMSERHTYVEKAIHYHSVAFTRMSDVAKRLKRARDNLQDMCPVCEREITAGRRKKILDDLAAEKETIGHDLLAFEGQLAIAREERNETAMLLKEARALEAHLAEMQAAAQRQGGERERLEEKTDKLSAKVEAARARLKEAKQAFQAASVEQAKYDFLVEAFGKGGMATDAVDHALPALNEEAARVVAAVSGGQATASFASSTTTKGGKEVDRLSLDVRGEGAKSYGASSEGEKATADLAFGMAIQSLVAGKSSCNVAFYDEVLDHLDAVAAERVAKLLKDEARDKCVFLVTHSDAVRGAVEFDGELVATKRGGTTTLAWKEE